MVLTRFMTVFRTRNMCSIRGCCAFTVCRTLTLCECRIMSIVSMSVTLKVVETVMKIPTRPADTSRVVTVLSRPWPAIT